MKRLIVLIGLSLQQFTAHAEVRLPKLFGNGMVLQRNQKIPVWGWADKGEKVTVVFRSQTKSVNADHTGKWKLELSPELAGGPFQLTVKGNNSIILKDVLVGEVWICSGQSNMEWALRSSNDAEKEMSTANYPTIRHFKVPNTTAEHPKDDLSGGKWTTATPETAGDFTAVGYFFARGLQMDLNVPIGLINSSWGGTDIETWISRPALEKSEILKSMSNTLPSSPNLEAVISNRIKQLTTKIATLQSELPKDSAAASVFRNADFDDRKWPMMPVPGVWEQSIEHLDGIAWLRTELTIDPKDAGKTAVLSLAMIDDSDHTYVNGVAVGSVNNGYNTKRIYHIPQGLLKAGKNVIAVRVEDTGGGGGIYGSPDEVKLQIGNETILLGGKWKFQVESFTLPSTTTGDPNSFPTLLFNGMINPIIPYGIKGAIWYQGENNAARAVQYREAFPLMINDWRNQWGQGDFPFYYVQLSSWIALEGNSKVGSTWAELREAQTKTLALPNTGMAVTIDIGETNDIHPRNKQDVGKRLAAIALNQAYHKKTTFQGPTFAGFDVSGKGIYLNFNHIYKGLKIKEGDQEVRGFEIAGADQKFYAAKGYLEGDKVVLSNPKVLNPVAVRYAWADDAGEANLFNIEGFPAVPFRTDNWKEITQEGKYNIR